MPSINTGRTHCPSPADVDFADEDGLRPKCLACLHTLLGRLVRHDIRGTWLVITPPAPVPAETVTA